MFSSRRPPEYAARGVGIGVFWAFTPLVGAQIAILFGLWGLIRAAAPRFDFNPIVAVAWVWLTNVFTLGPIYFVFVKTGHFMLGRWDEPLGYHTFTARLHEMMSDYPDAGFFDKIWLGTVSVLDAFGLPLFLGCLPWAIGLAVLGYFWALRFVRRRHERREVRRREQRQKVRAAHQAAHDVAL